MAFLGGGALGGPWATFDNDDTRYDEGHGRQIAIALSASSRVAINADLLVDGLLIAAGEDPSLYDNRSAVEPASWARIKASF